MPAILAHEKSSRRGAHRDGGFTASGGYWVPEDATEAIACARNAAG